VSQPYYQADRTLPGSLAGVRIATWRPEAGIVEQAAVVRQRHDIYIFFRSNE
jgi:hypothetical protein